MQYGIVFVLYLDIIHILLNNVLLIQFPEDYTKCISLSSSGVIVYLPVSILRGATPQRDLAKADL